MKRILCAGTVSILALASAAAADIKIAHVYGKTGPFEAYAKQSHDGLMLGLEYATGGTMEIDGEKIVVIEKDTQLKPENGKALLEEAYGDDEVDLAVGPVSSGVALAMLPVAEEYEKVLIVEPAVADSITGANWNRYIFRTGRNSSQDAVSNAIALAGENVHIATLAQDYAFGRDGIAAFKEALEGAGSGIVHEEYVPTDTTDFTAAAERIFNAMKDLDGEKRLFIIWAGGGNPMGKIQAMDPSRFGIEIATGGNILAAMAAYKDFPGMQGATYYYYEIPQNPVNDWLVKTHQDRFGTPPDFFTAGGMAAGIAVVEAIKKAGSTDTEALISAMEGMEWETPKGKMMFRPEDHQAMQSMYHFKIKVDPNVDWAIPELVRELTIDDLPIPIRNN
ncbi:substrate-binding domain-containing protein [Ruegeria pomeroyi]|uniref:Branched-chain amino acid ABC transporter, periplasmic branched-chain amino acid-binding protein n=2 Tax=Ruegeria pomeroyi TaxID=89184 RepID=Q5LM59_RUEPO|nr:substrate-binding domain-containing protein [Ruegeria pomeroyi]HCE71519.1 ABC transporter permease [Ruegeria sp.]AAV96926.1 branched-chain amino acid ABC transporter, periplasmic branched-chain amino acid-binding protein [Ruegeria pomeroyi DSS-3]NVK97907.1 substrate-binding domain-containing protein [Ruegeria pomeroyi]NVL02409.1 substrate-binding domain-containing protein [Ruegeria pomeroyi]QWV10454.1 substrate-binding domain-containing protein [Ruegeria pomeroyi]